MRTRLHGAATLTLAMFRRRRHGAALSLLLIFWTGTASAQESEYDRLLDDAVAEFGQGHWTEALAFFGRAHAILPNARTLRGMGCDEQHVHSERTRFGTGE